MKNKIIASCLIGMSLITIAPIKANAQWIKNSTGWWYSWKGSYAVGWHFIDNKWYYFDNNGYMAHDTSINGDYVGSDGSWLYNTSKGNQPGFLLSKAEFSKAACDKMHELVNEHRKANGVEPLSTYAELDNSAYLKSKHMCDNKYFSHDYNDTDCSDLAYELSGEEVYGENIAMNYYYENYYTKQSAEELAIKIFEQWKKSPGHNRNMLNRRYDSFGFGFEIDSSKVYATQQFTWDD